MDTNRHVHACDRLIYMATKWLDQDV